MIHFVGIESLLHAGFIAEICIQRVYILTLVIRPYRGVKIAAARGMHQPGLCLEDALAGSDFRICRHGIERFIRCIYDKKGFRFFQERLPRA